MSKLLCIMCNPKPAAESRGKTVANAFLENYQQQNPNDEVVTLDLFDYSHARIDKDVLDGWGLLRSGTAFSELAAEQQEKIAGINTSADYFSSFDKYVFVTPMWNLGFPAELKMYIDSVCVAGKTFAYTEKGPVGLLKNQGKKCLHIHSNGGFHFGKEEDHSIPYLKSVTNFMGIEDFDYVLIEGADALPHKAGEILDEAVRKALELSVSF